MPESRFQRQEVFRRLKQIPSLHRLRALEVGVLSVVDRMWERRYNVVTNLGLHERRSRFFDDLGYEPIRYDSLWRICRKVPISAEDVFVDIGCGRGRVVCMMAAKGVRESIGVEYVPEYAAAARANAAALRGRQSDITIVQGDAGRMDYSAGTVFYMFNPFGAQTLERVLLAIKDSLDIKPRRIRIIYVYPLHQIMVDRQPWLRRVQSFAVPYRLSWRHEAIVWQNTAE